MITELPEVTKHTKMARKIREMAPQKKEAGSVHTQRLLTTLLDLQDRTTQIMSELRFAITSNSL